MHLLNSFKRLICLGSLSKICYYFTILISNIIANYYTNIVEFKPLRCVYTTGFIY